MPSDQRQTAEKAELLRTGKMQAGKQLKQLENPDAQSNVWKILELCKPLTN